MTAKAFIDNAKVMAKGPITIPKDIRDVLSVASGDRVTFMVEGNTVRMVNSAVYAMQMLQQECVRRSRTHRSDFGRGCDDTCQRIAERGQGCMRVLIDPNVFISAALSANGTPCQAYVKAASYPNHELICEQNVDELKRIFNKV
jgi:AbrB family looped-hinge helix DNA binding protein